MTNPILILILDQGNILLFPFTYIGKEGDTEGISHEVLSSGKFGGASRSPLPLFVIRVAYIRTYTIIRADTL